MLQKEFLQNIIKNSVSFYVSKFVLISVYFKLQFENA